MFMQNFTIAISLFTPYFDPILSFFCQPCSSTIIFVWKALNLRVQGRYKSLFKLLFCCSECFDKMEGASGKSSGGISCTDKDAKSDDVVVESANISDEDAEVDMEKSSMVDASALTETGDFDYRQSTFGSGETEGDRQNSALGHPLGLGCSLPKNQDADLRLLLPSVNVYIFCVHTLALFM